jgi:hypothetical protein
MEEKQEEPEGIYRTIGSIILHSLEIEENHTSVLQA